MKANKEKYVKNYKDFLLSRDDDIKTYKNIFEESEIFNDSSKFYITKNGEDYDPIINIDWVYQIQDMVAMQIIVGLRSDPDNRDFFAKSAHSGKDFLLDIGSRFSSAGIFSSFFTNGLHYVELSKSLYLPHLNMGTHSVEAQNLPLADNIVPLVTSLHAIEHFGLGRYGDEIDYYGDIKAIREIHRVLQPGGYAIISIPCTAGKSKIHYHTERIYNVEDFNEIMKSENFEIVKDPHVLNTIRVQSQSESNNKNLDERHTVGRMGLCIIPSANLDIAWDIDQLSQCEELGIKHSAYISAWRKK